MRWRECDSCRKVPTRGSNSPMRSTALGSRRLLSEAVVEMQSYHGDRSPEWQESARAEELLGKVEQLQETIEQLQGID